jgi:hypothetical protein
LPSPSEFVQVPAAPPLVKVPVPAAEERNPVLDKVREEYQTHVRQPRAAELALARRLFVKGQNSMDDPVLQYALLREARFVYARCGRMEEAFQAVEELDKNFRIDNDEEKTETLVILGNAIGIDQTVLERIAERALALFEEARSAKEPKIAALRLKVAEKVVERMPNQAPAKRALIKRLRALDKAL